MFGFDNKKKKIFTISTIVYAVILLLSLIIINFDRFSSFGDWLGDKLSVLSPLLLGAIFAYICNSLVNVFQNQIYKKMENKRLRRTLSIVSAYVAIITFLATFILLIIPQLISSAEELIKKVSDGTYLNALIKAINDFLNNAFSFKEDAEYVSMEKIATFLSGFFESTGDLLQNIWNWALSYGSNILSGFYNVFLGFLLSIYFVVSKDRLYAQATRIMNAIFSKERQQAIMTWFRSADKTFGGFIVGKLIDATIVSVICSIVFSIADIPFSILISCFIGICNVIPFFGPFIGAIPSGFIVFIAEPDKLLLFVILIFIIQQIDANMIEPKIVGDRTGLSSLGVLAAVIVMGGYFGILGMFLGVPICAVICSSVRKLIKRRLRAQDRPTELSSYYSEDALAEPHHEAEHVPLTVRIRDWWKKKFKKNENTTLEDTDETADKPTSEEVPAEESAAEDKDNTVPDSPSDASEQSK